MRVLRGLSMLKNRNIFALAVLMAVFFTGFSAAALAQVANDPAGRANVNARDTQDLAAQIRRRPRVVIRPRRIEPDPNAKRQCQSWLAQEYRVSGPVIVPQMRCWWE
jgi:hypothetical protein